MAKWVYMFTEGNADMRNLLGGKGANLAEMTNLGLPVPQDVYKRQMYNLLTTIIKRSSWQLLPVLLQDEQSVHGMVSRIHSCLLYTSDL